MRALVFAWILFAVLAFGADAPSDDAALKRRLVGTWVTDPAEEGQFQSTVTYRPDGTGTELVSARGRTELGSVRVTIRWGVTNGILSLRSVDSSDANRIPTGVELKDRILSISEARLVFEALEGYGEGKGKKSVKVRKK